MPEDTAGLYTCTFVEEWRDMHEILHVLCTEVCTF